MTGQHPWGSNYPPAQPPHHPPSPPTPYGGPAPYTAYPPPTWTTAQPAWQAPPPGVGGPGWYPWPPPKPKRSRRGRLVASGLVLAIAGGAIGAGIWAYRQNQQEAQLALIRAAVIDFAEATDTVDFKRMSELLCDEEAAQLNDGLDPDALDGPIEPAQRRPVNIGDITVNGDTATAAVTRPPAPTRTMQLKRERGEWRLCNPDQ